jgi:hypothetical protein
MQTRHAVLGLLVLSVGAGAAFAYLGWRRRLPPALADAYGNVATLASAAASLAAPVVGAAPDSSATPDAGDAGAVVFRPTTQTAPLSSAQLGAPLVHGKFVSECGAPDDMKVVVKVTVKKGHAVAVTVTTEPANAAIASCVRKATRAKLWDVSPATQHATVTY